MVARWLAGTVAALSTSLAAAGAPADPLTAAVDPLAPGLGAKAYRAACAAVTDEPARRRWSAASELLGDMHPSAASRDAARACQQALLKRSAPHAPGSVADGARRQTALRIARLEREFERNLAERQPQLVFTLDAVKGFPPDWLPDYRLPGRDAYVFGVGPADYFPFMSLVDSSAARQRMYVARANRGGPRNLEILAEIVDLRRQLAAHSGVSFAALAGERGAVPHGADSLAFLAQIGAIIEPAFRADTEALRGIVAPSPLHRWDVSYALEKARERLIGQGDMNEAARVPANALGGWLRAYFEKVAGVRIEPAGHASWHAAVECFAVGSAAQPEAFGNLCLDLHPRPGKYYNYATYVVPPAQHAPATAVLLANLSEQRLTPDEVERTFGEFAVALSSLTTRSATQAHESASLARWQAVQRDFFGSLPFTPELVALLHAQGTATPTATQLLSIRANRDFALGLARGRDLMIAKFDALLAAPTAPGRTDLMATWRALENESGLPYEPGSYLPSTLNQLTGGSAGFIHFALWAEAAASAALERFEGRSLDPLHVLQLRASFFEPGPELAVTQRLEMLLEAPFSLEPFRRRLERNTIATVTKRAPPLSPGAGASHAHR